MLKIILGYYKKMKMQNILSVILFFQVFQTLLFLFNNALVSKQAQETIFRSYPKDAAYISYAFTQYDKEKYKDVIEQMKEQDAESYIGYELTNRSFTVEKEPVTTVYLSKYLSKFEYYLQDGKWLEQSDKSGIVIGGSLCRKYDIGDKICLQMDNKNVELCVVGKLGECYEFMFLNVAGESLNYGTIITKSDDAILLTVDQEILLSATTKINTMSVVADKNFIEQKNLFAISHEQITKFEDLKKNKSETDHMIIEDNGMIVILVLATIFCLIYQLYIYIRKSGEIMFVLWELGMNNYCMTAILVAPQFLNALFGIVFVLLYEYVIINENGSYIKSSSGYLVLCMLGIINVVYFFSRKVLQGYLES